MDYKSAVMDIVRQVRTLDKAVYRLEALLSRAAVNRDCPGDIGPHESFKPTTPGNPAEALFILEHILAAEIRNLVVCLKRALASSTETEMYRREVSPNASESSKAENDS